MTIFTHGPIGSSARLELRGASRALALASVCALALLPATSVFADPAPAHIRVAQAAPMAPPAAEQTIKAGDLVLVAPWTRATPGGASVAGGFVRITNNGKAADRLVGGSSVASGRFEVHEMTMNDGVMRMRPVIGGLEIKPGATLELKPGSYHVMFMELKQQFKEGEGVKATLEFEKAGKVDITFRVGGLGEGASHNKH